MRWPLPRRRMRQRNRQRRADRLKHDVIRRDANAAQAEGDKCSQTPCSFNGNIGLLAGTQGAFSNKSFHPTVKTDSVDMGPEPDKT
jgi:hypothetical protein